MQVQTRLFAFQNWSTICSSQGFGPNGGGDLDLWQAERPKDMANIGEFEFSRQNCASAYT